jgi:hypothetical protein
VATARDRFPRTTTGAIVLLVAAAVHNAPAMVTNYERDSHDIGDGN